MQKNIFLSILCAVIILSSCSTAGSSSKNLSRHKAINTDLFGTYVEITAYTATTEEFDLAAEQIIDLLENLDRQYDIYTEYDGINNLKTINNFAGIRPVAVSGEIIELLVFSKQAFVETEGAVNTALGSVLSIWHNYRETGMENPESATLPDMNELIAAQLLSDMSDVIIDEVNKTVFLSKPDMSLDVGALAKGFAAEKAIKLAGEIGLTSCLIDFGGNVVTLGKPEEGNRNHWKVGVQNPTDIGGYLDILSLNGQSAVTSGDYQRYYEVDSVRYHHIINPGTLMPSSGFKAVTVVASDSGIADMLSTALFILPFDEGERLAVKYGAAVIWVFADGTARVNSEYRKISQYFK